MMFGNKYFSKAISSVLLVSLLLIHSVRLLHSHPNHSFCSKDIRSNSVVKNSSDCSVCNYQLAKDTDAQHSIHHEVTVYADGFSDEHSDSFYKASFYSAFDSRGPPSTI